MLNVAVLMGRLTADPELRQTPNGISVTSFTLACDRSYAKAGTERQTDFIHLQVFPQRPVDGCAGLHSNPHLHRSGRK